MNNILQQKGYYIIDDYLSAEECRRFQQQIVNYERDNTLKTVERSFKGRSLRYKVIDGIALREHFPSALDLYRSIQSFINKQFNGNYVPLDNDIANANINITEPGGEYRWHYDRNEITVLLYLNDVESGELEFYPNYRLFLGKYSRSKVQQILDTVCRHKKFFRRRISITPKAGKLVIIRGDKCLHSVKRVLSGRRINFVFSYDSLNRGAQNSALDSYLYTNESINKHDPNYNLKDK